MNRPFRIAFAALTGALAMTAMVAPMASAEDVLCVRPPLAGNDAPPPPLSARLSITPVVDGHNVVIYGFLRTRSAAEAHSLYVGGWRAKYTLWGDDPESDGDDQLGPSNYRFDYLIRGDSCQGEVYFHSSRFYKTAAAHGWGYLDEDSTPPSGGSGLAARDEVYAEVRFGPTHRAITNTVVGFF